VKPIKLYNSLTRKIEDFQPLDPKSVGLYTCGPTVYNYLHVGNYRTYVFEDVLRRTLEAFGYPVKHVMNITDVGHLTSQADEGEDKLAVAAAREGKTAWEIAKFYTETFVADSKELDLRPPHVLCNATDHIPEQIAMVETLDKKGFLYKTSDGLYFDTEKFKGYARLAGEKNIAGLMEGARVEANPEKKRPTDFAVWKFSPKGEKRQMEWPSPWGVGFPGWHIECSAMAMKYLGESFDIHCGGVDHIPIHHTNEIAQAEAATGKPFVRFWMHGEFLTLNAAKMAKSSGGFIKLSDLKEKGFDPLDYRYHCLTAHYRKQLDFSWEALEGSKTARRRLRESAALLAAEPEKPACAEELAAFEAALADDLNAPAALSVVWDALKKNEIPAGARAAFLRKVEEVFALGLFTRDKLEIAPEVQALIDRRAKARQDRDFKLSDDLRKELDAQGILVEDTKQGQKWRKK
jgi:cysteinyl-tRNA synthetase